MMRHEVGARRCKSSTGLRRSREAGFTLVDVVVAIAVISIGVVGIAYGFSALTRSAVITQDQAQLEVTIRHISDYVRDKNRLVYQPCATTSTYAIPNPLDGVTLNPPNPIGAIALPASVTRGISIPPLEDCTTKVVAPATCPANHLCDWGVQEIRLSASSLARSLTRVVWKGNT
ncbi:MAG: hypothetical protein E6J14_10815 [Chloroflexi bacterium]|nr:MAG: hypothetical protein E6J14_10815 [Chloroflexota bacterium]